MGDSKQLNASGEPLFHLRRIGPKATKPEVVDRMDFYKVISIIGRNADQVDFLIDSSNDIQRLCLSRCHARVVRQPVNQHRLYDDSMNGVFVNNMKIAGSCVMREGDRVTFGHPSGQKLSPGSRSRQPDSEHQFLFELCTCAKNEECPKDITESKAKQESKPVKDKDGPKQMSQEEWKQTEEEIQRKKQEKIDRQQEKERRLREKEEEKERLKKLKFEQKIQDKRQDKKKEKVNFTLTENKLILMDVEIKRSLRKAGNADIDKCIAIMEDLDQLPVNFVMLRKNPDIMNTMKKCRKYKGSQQIQKKADDLYCKFKQLFLEEADKAAENNCETEFKAPLSIVTASQQKKRGRMPTQTFTQEQVKQLRQSWEERSEARSDETDAEVSDPVLATTPGTVTATAEPDTVPLGEENDTNNAATDLLVHDKVQQKVTEDVHTAVKVTESETEIKTTETVDNNMSTSDLQAAVSADGDKSKNEDKTSSTSETAAIPEQESEVSERFTEVPTEQSSPGLEQTVESLMQDLATIRSMVELTPAGTAEASSVQLISVSVNAAPTWKSPTKDASIQTSDMKEANDSTVIARKLDSVAVALDNAEFSSEENHDVPMSTNCNAEVTSSEGDVDTSESELKEVERLLLPEPLSNSKSDNTTDLHLPVDEDKDTDIDSEDNFECEVLPKEDPCCKSADETEECVERISEQELKASYMLSDSVEFDFDENVDNSDPEPESVEKFEEVEKDNDDDSYECVSSAHSDDDCVDRISDESSECNEKVQTEQLKDDLLCDNLEDTLVQSERSPSGDEVEVLEKGNEDMEVDLDVCKGSQKDKHEQNKEKGEENQHETEPREDDVVEKVTFVSSDDKQFEVSESEAMDHFRKIEDQEVKDIDISTVQKNCTEETKMESHEENNSDGDVEREKTGARKKYAFKSMMGNIAGSVKGLFTNGSSKKSYSLTDNANQNFTNTEEGTGQCQLIHVQNKDSSQDSNQTKRTPEMSNCEKEKDFVQCERDTTNDEKSKLVEQEIDEQKIMENDASGGKAVDDDKEDIEIEIVIKEVIDPETSSDKEPDTMTEENVDTLKAAKVEDIDLSIVKSDKNSEQLEQATDNSVFDEVPDVEDGFETVEITVGNEVPDEPKTPEKNGGVIFSSQLSSPILDKYGIDKFTSEPDSPVIARQETVCSEKASVDADDKPGESGESENEESNNVDEEDETSNDGTGQLSCNFSDDENGSFGSPPDVDFSNWDDDEYDDYEKDEEDMDYDEDKIDSDDELSSINGSEKAEISDYESSDSRSKDDNDDDVEIIDVDEHSAVESFPSDKEENIHDSDTELKEARLGKKPVKRKCEFNDVDSPKKQKSSDEEDIPSFKTPDTSKFKTPNSTRKVIDIEEAPVAETDPEEVTGTQLMNTSASLDMSGMTATQMDAIEESLEEKADDKARKKPARSKAKDLLARLRAKRLQREVKVEPVEEPAPSTSQGQVEELYNRRQDPGIRSAAEVTLQEVDSHINRCREVLCQLRRSFDGEKQLKTNPRVVAWRQELAQIEKKLEFPKTIIAVVGDTGAGKSSLMNAILDHRSVLPTSGMRACTAVVVEVVENTTSDYLEADIEFLQRKEWLDELQVLLRDLTGFDGQVKNRQPDPASDAYVSYCKVKAVYGQIDRFEVLSRINLVTHWLGKTKVVKSSKPEEFRRLVERYIETQEPGAGGQYWPIVKHVRLRMPQCDVCSSGAALVDLPGVRDSNAARDKIAREYLKNCTAVWVVSSIHRAIDDKTAKDLLGENFRRQLLMDGQYGSIAFVCTKTDVIIPSEIIRPLKLEDRTKSHEDTVSALEEQKSDQQMTATGCAHSVAQLRDAVTTLEREVTELNDNLAEIRALLEAENTDSEQTEEHEALQEYQEEVRNKEAEIETHRREIDDMLAQRREAKQKIHELETKLNVHRREITAICAKARNEYSKKEIRRDFKAGLKEMKRRAGMINDEEEEEEDDDDDDDDDADIGSTADNLKVFCCSSTEYQKLKNLLTDDGPAQVFSSLEDTEVPSLRRYVHEMTSVRRQQALESMIRSLGRFVFDLQSYTTTGNCMHGGDRLGTKSVIESQVQQLDAMLVPVLKQLQADVDVVFDGSIRPKMQEGAGNASSEANNTVAKWGAPMNKDKTDRRSGGLHWATYRATVRREGVYGSRTFGAVDMNEELAEPVYRSMTIVWDKAFSGMLWRVMEKVKTEILAKLRALVGGICLQLQQLGVQGDRAARVGAQLQGSAANKLTEMVNYLKELITERQRNISRTVTPTVQEQLVPTYSTCAAESGPGMYMRMKNHMSQGVDMQRVTMFDEATGKLMQALVELQSEIQQYVQGVCRALITDVRVAFEPLWDTPVNTSMLRSAFLKPVTQACTSVREVYRLAGLENTEEKTLAPTGADNSNIPVTAMAAATCTTGTVKQENLYVAGDSNVQCTVTVKTEPAVSTTFPQPGASRSGVSLIQVKQEAKGQGSTRNCTIGSGTYQPVILPSSAPGYVLSTHNAFATGSAITVPPCVGATAGKVTPACSAPQYSLILKQGANGGMVIHTPSQHPSTPRLVPQTCTQNSNQKVIIVNQQALSSAETSRAMSNSPVNFTPHGKENAFQMIMPQNSKTKATMESVSTVGVSVKKEPADTGYERNRKRQKFLGTIDLTDD